MRLRGAIERHAARRASSREEPGLREADIALTEIANGKLTFESTFGQNENAASAEVVEFPKVIVAKKAETKKKAA